MDEQGVDIDPFVRQHAIDLLDRVLGQTPASQRQPLADQGDRERRGYNCPGGGTGQ